LIRSAERSKRHCQRDLNKSATNIPSACKIANIALNDALILYYDANLGRMEFSEGTGNKMKNILGALIVAGAILILVAIWVYFTK
jgi:hypothetical protein